MPLQPPNFFGLVDPTNPVGTDSRTISDDYHRMALASMQQQAPNWTGAITASHEDLNLLAGAVNGGNKVMIGVGGTTVVYFYNNTVPPFWTVTQPDTNLRNLTIAGSGDTGGTIDGTIDPSAATLDVTVDGDNTISVNLPANTGGHALTAAENGPHSHTQYVRDDTGSGTVSAERARNFSGPNAAEATASSGSGTAHTHPLGGTATGTTSNNTAAFNPRRAIGILGTLNA